MAGAIDEIDWEAAQDIHGGDCPPSCDFQHLVAPLSCEGDLNVFKVVLGCFGHCFQVFQS